MGDRFARLAALKPARPNWHAQPAFPRGEQPELPHGAQRLADLLGGSAHRNHFGEHLRVREWVDVDREADLDSVAALASAALPLLAPDAPDDAADPRKWLFLDTETTGLAGGTGTYAFLVGLAWWDAGGLEVEQLFLREPSEEHSLLTALSERLAERPVLVTFNGKSFDWPLLDTRYRMTRVIETPSVRAHLDFLHPARALWRPRVGSVRLAELERHVLGWERGADVVSEMIPQLYFDFLHGAAPDPLVPVFRHNQMDLRGLARVAARVLGLLAHPELHGEDAMEIFGASRICERRGHTARARTLYAHSIEKQLPPATDRTARRLLARLAKRQGDYSAACDLWEGITGNSVEGFEAYEQLAIHCERREKDPRKALGFVAQALVDLRRSTRLGLVPASLSRRLREKFEKREARLRSKCTEAPLLDENLRLASRQPAPPAPGETTPRTP